MNKLNSAQLAAIHCIDSPLLVIAGAGSGKTRVITHKIAYLINDCGIKASHIYAVTFTNKAAREMAERAKKLLKNQTTRFHISTFHTFGLKFIRQEHHYLGLNPNFSIFDTEDSLNLIRELLLQKSEDNKEKLNFYLQQISKLKNSLISPEVALNQAKDDLEFSLAKLYGEYQKQLHLYNSVDFDDLIFLPVKTLTTQPDSLEKWQQKIHYLLVDEYQDTNKSQYALVQLLSGVQGRLTVVGDDHQSIYAWRGAAAENLLQLQQDYPNLKVIKLEQNYRSSSTILKASNHLISHNPSLFKKNLWSHLGIGDPITILVAQHEEHEANRVVVHLLSHQFQHRIEHRDYAILYRGNHQARIFEKVLREHRIPCQVSGGISFFSRTEIKDILSYLKLLVNPDDDCAFLRIVNTPKREIGPATLEKLGAYAKLRNLSLFSASFELGLEQTLDGKPLERLRNFTNWINLIADNAKRGDTFGVLKDMMKNLNYESWLLDTCSNPKTVERKMKNVEELMDWLKRLLDPSSDDKKSLTEVVHSFMLMDLLDRNQEQKTSNAVQLMTLHAAKGLEFPHVFMVGMEEGLLPHQTCIDENNIEEERRLAYVGMTRAKKTLTLSFAKQRRKYNEMVDCVPSRFLDELPKEEVVWDGDKVVIDPKVKEQRGKSHLSVIRGLLKEST